MWFFDQSKSGCRYKEGKKIKTEELSVVGKINCSAPFSLDNIYIICTKGKQYENRRKA